MTPDETATVFHESLTSQMMEVSRAWLGNQPSDHATVLVQSAMLDSVLAEALRRTLLGTEERKERLLGINGNYNAPLATFSSRILAGQLVGLYGETTYRDLNVIREIRNAFAHWATKPNPQRQEEMPSFSNDRIANWCRNLKYPDCFKRPDYSQMTRGAETYSLDDIPALPPTTDPKERFNFAVTIITKGLAFGDPEKRPAIVLKHGPALP